MQLKNYQQRSLDILGAYFQMCHQLNSLGMSNSVGMAFTEITNRLYGQGLPYAPIAALPGLPYVCLRVPTGGGKTLMACHAISVTTSHFLRADRSLVLWLVPSNSILEQTLKALKNRNHPYRQAIESRLGSVTVLNASEALYVQPGTLQTDSVIIVSTIQAFRVEETEGRKVYEPSGVLMSHFDGIPTSFDVERYSNGVPIPSLANVLRMHRPIVIVDEAHNSRTTLSFDTLARFNPACILEFTATPDRERNPSNILYSISAAELKAEQMIKMPIHLETRPQWKEIIGDAVNALRALERIADQERVQTGEYIRPIMLLQAQPRSQARQTLTVDVVETCLKDDYSIPADQIARATGDDYQIEGVDLSSSTCKIRYIITVQALREGWDCPFAYVLCSVAEQHGSTAVEQILGRVLRMPKAMRKKHKELNLAYAFVSSPHFAAAANQLADALVQNGFERQEVGDLIIQPRQASLGPLFDYAATSGQDAVVTVPEPPALDTLPTEVRDQVTYDATNQTITVNSSVPDQVIHRIREAIPEAARAAYDAAVQSARSAAASQPKPSADQSPRFTIPILAIQQGNQLLPFEERHFLDSVFEIADKDPTLDEAQFATERPAAQKAEIDISTDGHVRTRFLENLTEQIGLLSTDTGWSPAQLIHWLDRNILHRDITAEQSGIFLLRVVQYLTEQRGIPLDTLVREKYRLRDAIATKIDNHRQSARSDSFNRFLTANSRLIVTPDKVFEFGEYPYPANSLHPGQHEFRKHFYPTVGDLRPGTEEFMCAQIIDSLNEVDCWVRNLEGQPKLSFWLQTSRWRFYPDFVCRLKDGRYLVVEYKGGHLYTDAEEKRTVGELWERRSEGRCLFIMPTNREYGVIQAKIRM